MPMFEFKCQRCGKVFERLCFKTEDSNVACPQCGSGQTSKIMSVFASTGIERKLAHSCGSHSGGSEAETGSHREWQIGKMRRNGNSWFPFCFSKKNKGTQIIARPHG